MIKILIKIAKKALENWVALTGLVGVVSVVLAVVFPPAAPFVLGPFVLGGLAVFLYAAIDWAMYFTSGPGRPAARPTVAAPVEEIPAPELFDLTEGNDLGSAVASVLEVSEAPTSAVSADLVKGVPTSNAVATFFSGNARRDDGGGVSYCSGRGFGPCM